VKSFVGVAHAVFPRVKFVDWPDASHDAVRSNAVNLSDTSIFYLAILLLQVFNLCLPIIAFFLP